jgi:hypothetical protein
VQVRSRMLLSTVFERFHKEMDMMFLEQRLELLLYCIDSWNIETLSF